MHMSSFLDCHEHGPTAFLMLSDTYQEGIVSRLGDCDITVLPILPEASAVPELREIASSRSGTRLVDLTIGKASACRGGSRVKNLPALLPSHRLYPTVIS